MKKQSKLRNSEKIEKNGGKVEKRGQNSGIVLKSSQTGEIM